MSVGVNLEAMVEELLWSMEGDQETMQDDQEAIEDNHEPSNMTRSQGR